MRDCESILCIYVSIRHQYVAHAMLCIKHEYSCASCINNYNGSMLCIINGTLICIIHSKLWLSPVHHGSMLWIHGSLHDVHQASVCGSMQASIWLNAVHQVSICSILWQASIWLNAMRHGINYSSAQHSTVLHQADSIHNPCSMHASS